MEGQFLPVTRTIVVIRLNAELVLALQQLRAELYGPVTAAYIELICQRFERICSLEYLIVEYCRTIVLVAIVNLHLRHRLAEVLAVLGINRHNRFLADEERGCLGDLASCGLVDDCYPYIVRLAGRQCGRSKQIDVNHRRAIGQTVLVAAAQDGS